MNNDHLFLMMPDHIDGIPTNEQAWHALVVEVEAQKLFYTEKLNDPKWVFNASEMSKLHASETVNISIEQLVTKAYRYRKSRYEIGINSMCSSAYAADIKEWEKLICA